MKNLRARVDIPIYGYNLTLIVCESIPAACKKYCPSPNHGEDEEVCKATSVLSNLDAYIIIDRIYLTPNTIAHEIDHIVHAIMRDVGVTECHDSEEAFAYLTGWIHGWVYETLRDKKVRIKYYDGKEA